MRRKYINIANAADYAASGARVLITSVPLAAAHAALDMILLADTEERHYAEVLRGHEQQLGAIREAMRHGYGLASTWSGFIGLQGK